MITDQQHSVVDERSLASTVSFAWETLGAGELTEAPVVAVDAPLSATISIGGAWTATLTVTVSSELARHFANELLGLGDDLEDEDIEDALGELANVVGGNVKGQIDGDTSLSLPTVSHGAAHVTGGQQTVSCGFTAAGLPMTWQLFERV